MAELVTLEGIRDDNTPFTSKPEFIYSVVGVGVLVGIYALVKWDKYAFGSVKKSKFGKKIGLSDHDAARELSLYIENDGELYSQRIKPVIANLQKKVKKGTYDKEKAWKLWEYVANDGAKKYHREFGSGGDWHKMFSVADRKACAKDLAASYNDEVKG